MAYITTRIDVDINLSDFDDDDIIQEVNDRISFASEERKRRLQQKIIDATHPNSASIDGVSLLQEMKMEICREGLADKTIDDLERFFN